MPCLQGPEQREAKVVEVALAAWVARGAEEARGTQVVVEAQEA